MSAPQPPGSDDLLERAAKTLEELRDQLLIEIGHVREAIRQLRAESAGQAVKDSDWTNRDRSDPC